MSAIADAVESAEEIMKEIDRRCLWNEGELASLVRTKNMAFVLHGLPYA
jgi:hypothetical protein